MIAVATALTFAWTSCEKPTPEPTPDPEQPGNTDTPGGNENQGTEIKEITAVLEGATSKTAWAEGDAILVYAVVDGADISAKYILTDAAAGKFVPSAKALPALLILTMRTFHLLCTTHSLSHWRQSRQWRLHCSLMQRMLQILNSAAQ